MMKNIQTTAIVLSLLTMTLSSCYSVMPISNANTATESKTNGKSVIVCYDSSIGTEAIEKFIKKNNVEVLYRYNNIHGYALKLHEENREKTWALSPFTATRYYHDSFSIVPHSILPYLP